MAPTYWSMSVFPEPTGVIVRSICNSYLFRFGWYCSWFVYRLKLHEEIRISPRKYCDSNFIYSIEYLSHSFPSINNFAKILLFKSELHYGILGMLEIQDSKKKWAIKSNSNRNRQYF